ncbi:MAG TPA: pilus assembly protein PilM [Verrucomicrobiae bacterium]|nr:pilus assembly protein PilM [Verrucomicrobiae bacterium]
MIAVDLGARKTKAVLLERRGESLALLRYALLDAPIAEKKVSNEQLTEHLRAVAAALDADTKTTALAIGLDDVVMRQVELPPIPKDDMRMVLKNNTKGYMQQDLPSHVFDCYIFPPKAASSKSQAKVPEPARPGASPKLKVLVAAAKQQLMAGLQEATRSAGLNPESVVPGTIGPINAFELAMPEIFARDSVALVDIGFKHSSVCVLDRGELILTRVVNIGGDRMTAGLAETMNISYAEAEGIKVGMGQEVQSALEMQVMPLGREIRASLDFFEHQNDRPVSQVFVSGGSAQSELILGILKSELIADCKPWNVVSSLQLSLPGHQAAEVEHIGSQLTVAIGAALAAF